MVTKAAKPLLSLEQIERCVNQVAAQIGVPPRSLPTYGSGDCGHPHIESDEKYHYVVVERGRERSRQTTKNFDELLYWIFVSVASSMAGKYELANRVSGKDSRRIMFRRLLELLEKLDPRWRDRCRGEIMETLSRHPFSDGGPSNIKDSGNGD